MNTIINQDVKEILVTIGKEIYELEGKNILITGAAGMLASYLVYTIIEANKTLFKKPCHLYLLTRDKTSKFGHAKYIHYRYGDIAHPILPVITPDMHYFIHAASKAAPKIYTSNMLDTINTNIKGLYNILDLVTTKTKSILYFSSGEVYGEPEDNQPIKEDYIGQVNHLNKRSCYTEGKRACETILMNYYWEKNFPIKIARIFHTFGPGLNLNDGRVFSDFIKNGFENKNIEIMGDKKVIRPLLYIKDATIMFFKILLSDKNGEIYNVGSDKNSVSVGEIAKIVCGVFREEVKHSIIIKISKKKSKRYLHAPKKIYVNIDKFIKEFKYKPNTSVKKAFQRTIFSITKKSI